MVKQNFRKILPHIVALLRKTIRHFLVCWDRFAISLLVMSLIAGVIYYASRSITPGESNVRRHIVRTAQQYLGCKESDGSHQPIIDRYNAHIPRARGYEVTYEDSWCATFTSAVAIEALVNGWIPIECSCEQQILLFEAMGRWVEDDCYLPKPGDFIYYDWNATGNGNCRGWSDHVGIVVQTFGPVIKVIEGNKNDDVSYRYVFVNDSFIRGFGIPDYKAISLT